MDLDIICNTFDRLDEFLLVHFVWSSFHQHVDALIEDGLAIESDEDGEEKCTDRICDSSHREEVDDGGSNTDANRVQHIRQGMEVGLIHVHVTLILSLATLTEFVVIMQDLHLNQVENESDDRSE